MTPSARALGRGLLGVLLLVLAWWVFTAVAGRTDPMAAAMRPDRVPGALAELWGRGALLPGLATSLGRLAAGVALAVLVGVPLGAMVGASRWVRETTAPGIQFLRMVSPLSWAPVAVAAFGIGAAPVVFIVAAAGTWPVVLNTAHGIRSLPPSWGAVARTLGASRGELLRSVVWPGVRPQVLTGIRLALGIAWVVLVPAEMLGVRSGLGYEILNARDRLAYDEMLVVILLIGAVGTLVDLAAQRLLSGAWVPARRRARAGRTVAGGGAHAARDGAGQTGAARDGDLTVRPA
ncbi:ABC transporter permease [Kytococcus schroeteri]|uniref:ABC transporter permease n=1 Tax=Kytococcus schroeteri TaxID=138300 RepID=UPI0035E48940